MAVVGIYTAPDGKVYGTGTFAEGGEDCPMVGEGGSAPAPAPPSTPAPASENSSYDENGSTDSGERDDDEMSAYGGEDSATTSPPVVTTGRYNAGESDGDYTKKSVEGENEGENEANDYSGEQSGDSGRYGSNGRTSEMSKDSQEGTSENSTGGQQSLSEGCARFVKWAARMLQL